MKIKPWSSKRHLGFESLEGRQMMAGNITAGLDVSGNLVITGDLNDNSVAIYKGSFGQLIVAGGNSDGTLAGRTFVNGQLNPVAINTSGGIVLNMDDGNDTVVITNVSLQGLIVGNLGSGDDQLAVESSSGGGVTFALNSGAAIPLGRVTASSLMNVSGDAGNDTFSLYDAGIGGALTLTGSDGNDLFNQGGTTYNLNVIAGDVNINGGLGDDVSNLRELTVAGNLTVTDGNAITGSTVTLTNVRVNLDIQLYLSIFDDVVVIQGEDNGANRFQARAVFVYTGDGFDNVIINQGIMVNALVSTGAGDEGNGFYGIQVSNLAINTRLYIDMGTGFDNALIQNINTNLLRVYGGAGSDGVIAKNVAAYDAIYDMGTFDDVVGLYDSTATLLAVTLSDGNDQLYVGNDLVRSRTTFDGGLGFNTYHNVGGNSFAGLTRTNI